MKVVKVLNNSLVLAIDDEFSDEVILMGKGIGFNAKVGDVLTTDKIEKIYLLKDRDTLKKMIQLSSETSTEYFDIAQQIIAYAKEEHHLQLKDYIYLSLTDHISFIKSRMGKGYLFQNVFTIDLKQTNPKEYDVAQYALKLLREEIDTEIPDSEAGYIAMHFIYQQELTDKNTSYIEINQLVEDILSIAKYQLQIDYNKDSIVYSRFVTHLSLFTQRIVFDEMIPNKENDIIYDQLIQNCTREVVCLESIEMHIHEKFGKTLTNQEKLYLLIHIHKIYEEYKIQQQ